MWKQCLGSRNFSVSFYFFLPFPSSSFFSSFFVFNFVLAILSEVLRLKGNPPFLFYFFLLYLIFFLVCRYRSIGHVEEGEIHPLEGRTTFLHSQTDHPSNTETNLERVAYSLQEKTIFTGKPSSPNTWSFQLFVFRLSHFVKLVLGMKLLQKVPGERGILLLMVFRMSRREFLPHRTAEFLTSQLLTISQMLHYNTYIMQYVSA